MILLTNSGIADGTPVRLPKPSDRMRSHLWTLFARGTVGGATVTFEISPDNVDPPVNWFIPTGGTFATLPTAVNFEFRGNWVRGRVVGGAPSGIYMELL